MAVWPLERLGWDAGCAGRDQSPWERRHVVLGKHHSAAVRTQGPPGVWSVDSLRLYVSPLLDLAEDFCLWEWGSLKPVFAGGGTHSLPSRPLAVTPVKVTHPPRPLSSAAASFIACVPCPVSSSPPLVKDDKSRTYSGLMDISISSYGVLQSFVCLFISIEYTALCRVSLSGPGNLGCCKYSENQILSLSPQLLFGLHEVTTVPASLRQKARRDFRNHMVKCSGPFPGADFTSLVPARQKTDVPGACERPVSTCRAQKANGLDVFYQARSYRSVSSLGPAGNLVPAGQL